MVVIFTPYSVEHANSNSRVSKVPYETLRQEMLGRIGSRVCRVVFGELGS